MFLIRTNANKMNNEYFVGQLFRCVWIGIGSDVPDNADVLYELINNLLYEYLEIPQRESLFCIARQFLALGLFPERGSICFHNYLKRYAIASVRSLQTEFFRNPLSLLQLSRAAIRRLLGMNGFERRAQTLPLSLSFSSTSGEPMRCSPTCHLKASSLMLRRDKTTTRTRVRQSQAFFVDL